MSVETVHPDYAARVDEWQTLRDVIAGSRAVKVAGERYLPALGNQKTTNVPGTNTTAYDAYKQRAKFYGVTERTQKAMVGTIFHKDLAVEGPDDLTEQLKDVTMADSTIEDFAILALSEVIGLGRFGILVDMPDGENPVNNRPYWVGYRTEQIVNWREVSFNGNTVLTMVVLKESYEEDVDEFETKKADQFRVLRLTPNAAVAPSDGGMSYSQTLYRKATEKAKDFTFYQEIVPTKLGKPLSFIPFQFIGPSTLGPCPEKPPLSEMAEINLHMYRRSATLEHGRHFTGLPQPVVIGLMDPPPNSKRKPLLIGSSEAWTLPLHGDAKYMEFTGQGLGSLVDGMQEDKEEIAELGSEMFASEPDSGNQETATAVRVRHSSKTASLKTIARRLGSALSKCLRWHAWWLKASQDLNDEKILAKVNTVFLDLKMDPDELKAWVLMLQAGGCSFATFYAALERGELTRPGVTAEEEKSEIDAEMPEPIEPVGPAPQPGVPMPAAPKKPAAAKKKAA